MTNDERIASAKAAENYIGLAILELDRAKGGTATDSLIDSTNRILENARHKAGIAASILNGGPG